MSASPAPLRVIIVDDEPLARASVRLALAADSGVTVIAECGGGDEAVKSIRQLSPDLVFLDVQMPVCDGFDVIEAIGVEQMPTTVFVTAFDAHALRAFDVRAIDYLVKPFDDDRLHEAVRRARARRLTTEADLPVRLAELLATVRSPAGDRPSPPIARFMVRGDDHVIPVRTQDVEWIEADGNYVRLHVANLTHRLRVSLKSLAGQLDSRRFVRVHKSAILNLDRVREIQPWFGGDYVAILHSGDKVRVSRTFAPAVLRPLQ